MSPPFQDDTSHNFIDKLIAADDVKIGNHGSAYNLISSLIESKHGKFQLSGNVGSIGFQLTHNKVMPELSGATDFMGHQGEPPQSQKWGIGISKSF